MKQIETSPFYYKSLMPITARTINYSCWDESVDLFKEKEYKASFYKLLDYLDVDARKGQTPTEINIPHGSAIINFKLTEENIQVKARVLKLTDETLRVPLMRALCEINFRQLGIPNACIENNEVIFYYNFEYELASPNKMYDVIWEICKYADKYDDEFVEKFKADFVQEPKVEYYTSEELETAYNNMQNIISSAIDSYDLYSEDRRKSLRYLTLSIAITQLEFYLQPQGYLKTRFEDEIYKIHDGDEDFEYRLKEGKDFLNELKAMSKEDITVNLYRTKYFVNEKYTASVDNIRKNWSNAFDRVREATNEKDYQFASLDMLNSIYTMFAYNNPNNSIAQPLLETLEKASNKSWKESSDILYDVFCYFMIEGYVMKTNAKGGVFSKILKSFIK